LAETDHDLIIRGGTIVDGSGRPAYVGDVAIDGEWIVAVGEVSGRGRREIAAKGLLVTPGFVDIHTHYDGQMIWSDRLTPSSQHGVTTVLTGNCGIGFAPCRAADREALIRMMEGVEDIPEAVTAEGLDWSWETFPQFLDAVERRGHDIDIAARRGRRRHLQIACSSQFDRSAHSQFRSRGKRTAGDCRCAG
jgi:N-acyl-D-aspartate/D-glutamate deacylase